VCVMSFPEQNTNYPYYDYYKLHHPDSTTRVLGTKAKKTKIDIHPYSFKIQNTKPKDFLLLELGQLERPRVVDHGKFCTFFALLRRVNGSWETSRPEFPCFENCFAKCRYLCFCWLEERNIVDDSSKVTLISRLSDTAERIPVTLLNV